MSHWSQNTKANALLVAQQSANCFPSHVVVEYDDVNVHDVVEVVPREAMVQTMSPETCIFIYLSHTDHTFYLRGLLSSYTVELYT